MTNRAKIANVRSIVEQKQSKNERRLRKQRGRQDMVLAETAESSARALKRAPDAVGLAERARDEVARMSDQRLFTNDQLDELGIVHPRSTNRALVDSLRQLRTKLYSLRPEGNFSVLVSSVVPQGGGSFMAMNLAATIAFDPCKTSLLIDANLHDPSVHRLLSEIGQPDAHGLIEYLERTELGIEDIVSPSGIPRLRLIPIGEHEQVSAEHFTSARYRQLIENTRERYDNRYVVVDGPAMSSSADARILSDICDYTVLVVPYGTITPGLLDSIVDDIDERKLAGIVLNDQPG